MDSVSSGERVKHYRKMLKISQKEMARNKLSHSMISLIESGKIQLTTVTAIILADNLNKIAAEKGIELNLSLKDMLMSKNEYIESTCNKTLEELQASEYDENKYRELYNTVKKNKLVFLQAKIKEIIGTHKYENHLYIEALDDLKESSDLYEKEMDVDGIVRLSYMLGRCSLSLGDKVNAESFFKKTIECYSKEELRDKEVIFYTLKELINLSIYKENYEEAVYYLENYLEYYNCTEESNYQILKIKSYIFLRQEKYAEALELYKGLLEKSLKDKHSIYHYISIALEKLGLKEEGDNFFNQALKYIFELEEEHVIENLMSLGNEYVNFAMYDKAVASYELSVEYALKMKDEMSIIKGYRHIYNSLSLWNNVDRFNNYMDIILKLLKNAKEHSFKLQYLILVIKFYSECKDYEKIHTLINSIDESIELR